MGSERGGEWRRRHACATAVRAIAVSLPLACSGCAAFIVSELVRRPHGLLLVAWWALIAASVVVTARACEPFVRRARTLATLLDLAFGFPNDAPSRLRVAAGAVSAAALQDHLASIPPTGPRTALVTERMAVAAALGAFRQQGLRYPARVRTQSAAVLAIAVVIVGMLSSADISESSHESATPARGRIVPHRSPAPTAVTATVPGTGGTAPVPPTVAGTGGTAPVPPTVTEPGGKAPAPEAGGSTPVTVPEAGTTPTLPVPSGGTAVTVVTGVVDTGVVATGVVATSGVDTSVRAATSVVDTGVVATGGVDTSVRAATSVVDTGAGDTGAGDTGGVDTSVRAATADVGGPTDAMATTSPRDASVVTVGTEPPTPSTGTEPAIRPADFDRSPDVSSGQDSPPRPHETVEEDEPGAGSVVNVESGGAVRAATREDATSVTADDEDDPDDAAQGPEGDADDPRHERDAPKADHGCAAPATEDTKGS